jgi:hypothetical protein
MPTGDKELGSLRLVAVFADPLGVQASTRTSRADRRRIAIIDVVRDTRLLVSVDLPLGLAG